MSQLPIASKYVSTPALPVSDEEREALVGRLNAAFADGVVSADAYAGLLDMLFAARTLGELIPVVTALPPSPTYGVPDAVAQTGQPGQLTTSRQPAPLMVIGTLGAAAVAIIVIAVLLLIML